MYHFLMATLVSTVNLVKDHYLPLIKGRQTILLALTGAAGYLCQPPEHTGWSVFINLMGSLLLTISGCTVLNMLFDRDIDQKMERTRHRPLAEGRANGTSAAWMGAVLLFLGLFWASLISWLYFLVILAGACLNVLVYTVWLKRRSAWSILLGGVAGGMPVLAGRVLAVGSIDLLGLMLAFIIVCWIPSHNLTLGMLYSSDYHQAEIPTILNTYGVTVTHFMVASSTFLLSVLFLVVFSQLGLISYMYGLFILLSLCLITLAFLTWVKSSPALQAAFYKYSSLYLLVATLLLIVSGMR